MNDPIDVLAQLRPRPGIAPDWPNSHAGQLCLQRARAAAATEMPLTRPGRSRRFKTVAGAATAAVVLAGAATAYGSHRAPRPTPVRSCAFAPRASTPTPPATS